jgi:uncharacterized protein YjbJ (UPF0337 family)
MPDMGASKGIADKAAGAAKEAVAEIIGDAELQDEGKMQRKGVPEKNEQSKLKPLGDLDKVT